MTPLVGIMLAAVGFALASKMLKGSIWPSSRLTNMGNGSKDKVIEIDDYEVLD